MEPTRDLAGRIQARHAREPVIGSHPDAAHRVVHRRADLHRAGRDVDVGELLELLIHRRQLAAHALGGQVADVEEDAAVGRATALADLGVDGSGYVVAGRELRRATVVGLASVRERIDPLAGLLIGTGVLVAPVFGR